MIKQLSTRDQRILDLLQRGESVAQTARLVGVSSRTVGRVRDANVGYKTPTKHQPTILLRSIVLIVVHQRVMNSQPRSNQSKKSMIIWLPRVPLPLFAVLIQHRLS